MALPPIVRDFENEIISEKSKKIHEVCKKYAARVRQKYALKTAKGYFTKMRAVMKNHELEDNPGWELLKLKPHEYHKLNVDYEKDVQARSQKLRPLDPDAFINLCVELVTGYGSIHSSYLKLAIGLAGLTGRRLYSEIITFGKLAPSPDADKMLFSGHAKSIQNDIKKPYKIPVLADPETILWGFRELRKAKKVVPSDAAKELKRATFMAPRVKTETHHEAFKACWPELKEIANNIENVTNPDGRKIVKLQFEQIGIQNPHDLRAAYGAITYHRLGKDQAQNVFLAEIFGHGGKRPDFKTPQSYTRFKIME